MPSKIKIKLQILPWLILAIVLAGAIGAGGYLFWKQRKQSQAASAVAAPKNAYAAFLLDIYDVIRQNYWNNISDADLTELYRLALEKVSGSPASVSFKDRKGLEIMIADKLGQQPADKKKDFVSQVGDVVLANLAPFGRSSLFSQKLVQQLANEVNNVDTSTDMYKNLGVEKTATSGEIEKAYRKKSGELAKQNTPEAKQQLALVERAHETLKAPERKQTYDQTGQEPAVTYRQLDPQTFYIKISRFTPTLVQEFQAAAKTVDGEPATLRILVLDLRGNIGGAIDQLPVFLGSFVGQRQYAFEYLHQGVKTPYQTVTGFIPELDRYKKVVVLIDGQTQSSAEVMSATLKKFNVGVLVGSRTKGSGTIERLFDIADQIDPGEKYYAYLVHTLTIADDGQPIEGRGVLPQVDIGNKVWEKDFMSYFDNAALLSQVKKLLDK